MKKMKALCLLLCTVFLLQCGVVPVRATETETTEVVTEVQTGTSNTNVPDVAYGSASITNGCRTINGQTPLGGSDRILQTSLAAFIYEANTQTVIYSYNSDQRVYPGTLTKIMTALLVIENCDDLERVMTCSTRWNSGLPHDAIDVGIKEGEEMTVYDVLCCMIIGSGNDAAVILANSFAPNEAAFVTMMNQRAKEIGCVDTHFTNCTGLDDPEQYTTARDMAKITLEACKNPKFKEIFCDTSHTVKNTNRRGEDDAISLSTNNYLMHKMILEQFHDERVQGGVASYTNESGASVSFLAEDDGMSFIMVTMGGTRTNVPDSWRIQYYGNFEEALDMLKFSFDGFRLCRLLYPGQTLSKFSVLDGESEVIGQSNVSFDAVLPVNVNLKNLIFRYSVTDGGLTAPVKEGDLISTVQIWYRTSCITETEVYAMYDVARESENGLKIQTGPSRSDTDVTDILKFLGIACLVIIVPFGIYVGVNYARRAARQSKRRRRRANRRRSR